MPPSRGAYQSHTRATFIGFAAEELGPTGRAKPPIEDRSLRSLMRRLHRKNAANRRSAGFYV
jgi:hypothetical protein